MIKCYIVSKVVFILIICIAFAGCSLNYEPVNTDTGIEWTCMRLVPFSGYIAGFENTHTFVQLPVFFSGAGNLFNELDISRIRSIYLTGESYTLESSDFSIIGATNTHERKYFLATLQFRVFLPSAGNFVVNQVKVILDCGTEIFNQLGRIFFDIIEYHEPQTIAMRQFMIMQSAPAPLKIAFENTSDYEVEIISLLFGEEILANSNISILRFAYWNAESIDEELYIPPNEERTFAFFYEINPDMFLTQDDVFLLLLPFIQYRANDVIRKMPAQIQATVVQTAFSSEFVSSLLDTYPSGR